MKKIFSAILCVIMILGCTSVAFATGWGKLEDNDTSCETYNINLYVDSSNFDIANEPGNSYLSYQLFKCNSQGNGCTTSLSNGIVNRNFYEISLYQESISKTTAGTKYYSIVLNYPKDENNVQSQYAPDGKLFNFAGHITITSDDRLLQ